MAAGFVSAFRLMTEHPDLTKYHGRWHRCEAVKLERDTATGVYVLYVTDNLGESVKAEVQASFDEMDAAA